MAQHLNRKTAHNGLSTAELEALFKNPNFTVDITALDANKLPEVVQCCLFTLSAIDLNAPNLVQASRIWAPHIKSFRADKLISCGELHFDQATHFDAKNIEEGADFYLPRVEKFRAHKLRSAGLILVPNASEIDISNLKTAWKIEAQQVKVLNAECLEVCDRLALNSALQVTTPRLAIPRNIFAPLIGLYGHPPQRPAGTPAHGGSSLSQPNPR